ncbi:aspartate 1-decarboxylase [Bradymonas sediminis]|uniref:Aspartate 1-decarboxylase n=1 Tax=Bradymonas sediminis TaxID=1548548 RepID=A0A2Z4FGG1_9DELT|nr:aspartate 1-decarboxylase [Bradymonas sediminis]AWV87970.1 aspartate 1-decarboxylase [Bradymonas sediminis]TDP62989.1 L-aspartate 1-decarboxylase [Bradymonas sediminis]
MLRKMMRSKIHRATVTHADLDYEGSVTIDVDLLEAADIIPYEWICIWNCTQGTRLETYVIPGDRGSGVICVNGAAAHLNAPGDIVILCTYVQMEDEQARKHHGKCVRVTADNKLLGIEPEIAGPRMPAKYDAESL